MNPSQKGRALEEAVHSIERLILQNSPLYNEQTFRIESRKIVKVDDVRHEIDLYVTVDLGGGYTTRFIFECKNWAERVGKNEIIIFSEKIAVTRAQHGFFVAREFTGDAIAQAAKDPRVQLRKANDLSDSLAELADRLHYVLTDRRTTQANITMIGQDGRQIVPDLNTAQLETPSGTVPLRDYLDVVGADLHEQALCGLPSQDYEPGQYTLTTTGIIPLTQSKIDGTDAQSIDLQVVGHIRVVRPAVVSQYEVESRGRVVWLEPVDFGQFAIGAKFVSVSELVDSDNERAMIHVSPTSVSSVTPTSERLEDRDNAPDGLPAER